MDEQDFRTALRATVTATSQPPPMAATPVLDAARRDRRRRHAMWAGVGSAAAVVAITVGVVIVAPSVPGAGDGGLGVGGTPSSAQSTDRGVTGNTETAWPNGQTDHVADSGREYDKAVALVAELGAVVPAGYGSPDDLVGGGSLDGVRLKRHQAQYENYPEGNKVWSYYADTPVTRGEGVGRLSVEVHAPAPGLSGPDGCGLGPADDCTEVLIGGRPVAVFPAAEDDDVDEVGQTAAYRHEDGTVVFLRQSTRFAHAGKPALPALPFTAQQLAELATAPRFHPE
jgi:hypothetical protein